MRKAMVAMVLVAVGAGSWTLMGQGKEEQPVVQADEKKGKTRPDRKVVKELMGKKLEISQKLLAALVMNDLPKASAEAENLIKLRKDLAWMIVKTETYELWSAEFTSSAEKVIKAAKDKNYDAAKLGYLEMTMTCFHCHTYVRDLGDIRFELPRD